MEKRILFLTVIALFALALAEDEVEDVKDAHTWDYSLSGPDGPSNWGKYFALCGGQKQSPINIEPKKGIFSQYLSKQPLHLVGYDEVLTGKDVHAINNGHGVSVTIADPESHNVGINRAGLPGQYILRQFHWHWGKTNAAGSEHTYDGKKYPMEMHFVHLNRRYLQNITAIETNQDGIAVLGVFIEVGAHNPAFDAIVNALDATSAPDATATSVVVTLPFLRDFLPKDLVRYYRYEGSLTTPPCYEAVLWTVLKEPIQISQQQLDAFRTKLKKDRSVNTTPSEANLINDNYRPVMPLNDRPVFVSYNDDTSGVIESESDHLKNWGYYEGSHGFGAFEWDKGFQQCGGKRQSPIHIEHSQTIPSDELSNSPWKLKNYDTIPKDLEVRMENNGHTVVVGLGEGIGVSGGGLPGQYRLAQFHIHWGRHNANGSEHVLDGRQYPAEIHFVHTNMYYGNGKDFDQIEANHDGLAVLGVFIEVGEHNKALDPVINQLSQIKYQSAQRVKLNFDSLRPLLPADLGEFYRYGGSLTTPPCYEIVVWTVFRNTIKMSQEQLNMLRTQVFDSPEPGNSYGEAATTTVDEQATTTTTAASNTTPKPQPPAYIIDNFRPLQNLGYRVVKYAKIPTGGVISGCSTLSLSVYGILMSAALLMKRLL